MPSKASFDIPAIRELARERVEESSLRAVAEEIGVSKSGLEDFLKGRTPYSTTRPKFAAWFVRNRRATAVTSAEVETAIALLAYYVSTAATEAVRKSRIREIVRRLEGTE